MHWFPHRFILAFIFIGATLYGQTPVLVLADSVLVQRLERVQVMSQLFLGETKANELILFNRQGKVQFTTGGAGSSTGSLSYLADADVFRKLQIVAVDQLQRKIKLFDRFLNYEGVFKLADAWANDYELVNPLQLAIDPVGDWYISDSHTGSLLKVNQRGEPQWQLYYPTGREDRSWVELSILQIQRDMRLLWLYDRGGELLQCIDFFGNEIQTFTGIPRIDQIFFAGSQVCILRDGSVQSPAGEKQPEALAAALLQLPGPVRYIGNGINDKHILILTRQAFFEIQLP
jgi:hypothetical protein